MTLTWGKSEDKPGGSGKVLFANGRPAAFQVFGTVKEKKFLREDGSWRDRIELSILSADRMDEDRVCDVLYEHSSPNIRTSPSYS